MRSFILIISSIVFFSCTSQKNIASGESLSSLSKPSSLGMKMQGKVTIMSKESPGGNTSVPVLYFDDGVAYLINLSESKVSKEELQANVYKDIDIIGEVKTGKVVSSNQKTKREDQPMIDGLYIVIYKIL